ncbi:rhomboid family intramembrane serine protease [bacterium]|nr:rhomboid family intramembrane serine protease [bacterium]
MGEGKEPDTTGSSLGEWPRRGAQVNYRTAAGGEQEVGGRSIWRLIAGPLGVVVLLWGVFWFDLRLGLELYQWGLFPGTLPGLLGSFSAWAIHGSFVHLVHNSLPVAVLTMGLAYFYPKSGWVVFGASALFPFVLAWFFARPSYHIGASGLVYALSAFFFVSGLLKGNRYLLAFALLVVFLYGGLFWGLFPIEEAISWEVHLSGGIVGGVLGVLFRKSGPQKTVYPWPEDDVNRAYEPGQEWMEWEVIDLYEYGDSGIERPSPGDDEAP